MNMKLGKYIKSAGLVLLTGLFSSAYADTLRYATPWPEGSIGADAAHFYAKTVNEYSDGEIKIKVYPMSLLSASEASAGTRDGLTDVGFIFAGYFPAEYPHTNFLNETSMQLHRFSSEKVSDGRGVYAFQGAITEFIFFNCPECLNEYADQNQVYTSNAAASMYGLLCNSEIISKEDLVGKRMRVAGSNWSRWTSEFGASSLSMTINDLSEALGQGVIDCTISSAPELINLRLIDVITDITMNVPGGLFAGAGSTNINLDVWKDLSVDQRTVLLRAGALMTAEFPWQYVRQESVALEQAAQQGIKIHQADQALVDATAEFAQNDMKTIVSYYEEKYGLSDAEKTLSRFNQTLDKWMALVQDVDSKSDLQTLYWDEIFSKVDVETYGM